MDTAIGPLRPASGRAESRMLLVYTIGYEGTDIRTFISVLKSVGISLLADVRAVPLSRKAGFSKKALERHLRDAGIEYRHFADLGDPREGREAARRGDIPTFITVYTNHLQTDPAQAALRDLLQLVPTDAVCMMCFERDPQTCHRSLIALEMKSAGLATIDLYADDAERYVRAASKLPRRDPGEGAPPAE